MQSVTGARAEPVTDCAPRPENLRSPGPQPCRHVAGTLRLSRSAESLFPLATRPRLQLQTWVGVASRELRPVADFARQAEVVRRGPRGANCDGPCPLKLSGSACPLSEPCYGQRRGRASGHASELTLAESSTSICRFVRLCNWEAQSICPALPRSPSRLSRRCSRLVTARSVAESAASPS